VLIAWLLGKGAGAGADETEVPLQQLAIAAARRRLAGKEARGALSPLGRVEQIGRNHGAKHEIVIDHRIIEHRHARIVPRPPDQREFSHAFFMGDLALRVEPFDHRAKPGFNRGGLELR